MLKKINKVTVAKCRVAKCGYCDASGLRPVHGKVESPRLFFGYFFFIDMALTFIYLASGP